MQGWLKKINLFPDLLLVDGGAGQINAAKAVLNELKIDLPLAGLAKDDKHNTNSLILENLQEVDLDKEDPLFSADPNAG